MSSPSSPSPPHDIPVALAPWTLHASEIYTIPFYTSSSRTDLLPSFVQDKGESEALTEHFKGGLGMVQVLRYTSSPVGAYDEMLIAPGFFGVPEAASDRVGKDGEGRKKVKERMNARITRIFVSTKESVWNGRRNWNIPKHLATFRFTPVPGSQGGMKIQVLPTQGSASPKSQEPFFQATFTPIAYVPALLMSTAWAKYLSMDLTLVQPPLKQIQDAGDGEVDGIGIGTEKWCQIMPFEKGQCKVGWWDMDSGERKTNVSGDGDGIGDVAEEDGYSKERFWWPGWGRWRFGAKMVDATVLFEEGKKW
ncbi:hypothetical protein BP5796_09064 [Coleophoma crateriformis]|uniref:Uncharacterized protein n=1 Tax=Coleophoma crateriformis TaxID=565419 RepID=A0A3D8R2Z5_9HELO|nr:hypothetical protein BP5796_09064 [Coleophoma crateriformis]